MTSEAQKSRDWRIVRSEPHTQSRRIAASSQNKPSAALQIPTIEPQPMRPRVWRLRQEQQRPEASESRAENSQPPKRTCPSATGTTTSTTATRTTGCPLYLADTTTLCCPPCSGVCGLMPVRKDVAAELPVLRDPGQGAGDQCRRGFRAADSVARRCDVSRLPAPALGPLPPVADPRGSPGPTSGRTGMPRRHPCPDVRAHTARSGSPLTRHSPCSGWLLG